MSGIASLWLTAVKLSLFYEAVLFLTLRYTDALWLTLVNFQIGAQNSLFISI